MSSSGPFSGFFEPDSRNDRLAAYIIREHSLGRPIEEIIDDPYLKNRVSREHIERLLERPDVIHAVTEDTAKAAKEVEGAEEES